MCDIDKNNGDYNHIGDYNHNEYNEYNPYVNNYKNKLHIYDFDILIVNIKKK